MEMGGLAGGGASLDKTHDLGESGRQNKVFSVDLVWENQLIQYSGAP